LLATALLIAVLLGVSGHTLTHTPGRMAIIGLRIKGAKDKTRFWYFQFSHQHLVFPTAHNQKCSYR
jgi:hypothetical protein